MFNKICILSSFLLGVLLGGCGGGSGDSSNNRWEATTGVAQKGPLILGSTVQVQELDSSLQPTGKQYTYQTNSDLGTFRPNEAFTSRYLGLTASGYFFDEVTGAISQGTITLNAVVDLERTSSPNINLLTTLIYQRVQQRVTAGASVSDAIEESEIELQRFFGISEANCSQFGSLDISRGQACDEWLVAVSAMFVMGKTSGQTAEMMAKFQSEFGTGGTVRTTSLVTSLEQAAQTIPFDAIATNMNEKYASQNVNYSGQNIARWVDTDGDGVVGTQTLTRTGADQGSLVAIDFATVSGCEGPVTATNGRLVFNGVEQDQVVSPSRTDMLEVGLLPDSLQNQRATVYLSCDGRRQLAVIFVASIVSANIDQDPVQVAKGQGLQVQASATFTDGSTGDVSDLVSWEVTNTAIATFNTLNNTLLGVAPGNATLKISLGERLLDTVSVTVGNAVVTSIELSTPPERLGRLRSTQLTATATFSDGTTGDITSSATWTTGNGSIASVVNGRVTGLAIGQTTVTASANSVQTVVPVTVATGFWSDVAGIGGGFLLSFSSEVYAVSDNLLGIFLPPRGATADDTKPTFRTYNISTGVVSPAVDVTFPLGRGRVAGSVDGDLLSPSCTMDEHSWEYDTSTNTWTSMPSAGMDANNCHITQLADGRLLALGGILNEWVTPPVRSQQARIYDPSTRLWADLPDLPSGFTLNGTISLPDGKLLVSGLYRSIILDPATLSWVGEVSNDIDIFTTGTASITLLSDTKVLLAGGANSASTPPMWRYSTDKAHLYDIATNTWTATTSMPQPRLEHKSLSLRGGAAMIFGGGSGGVTSEARESTLIYRLETAQWESTPGVIPYEGHVTMSDGTHYAHYFKSTGFFQVPTIVRYEDL